jgi:tetratricopeptide (TPR) repeat protein
VLAWWVAMSFLPLAAVLYAIGTINASPAQLFGIAVFLLLGVLLGALGAVYELADDRFMRGARVRTQARPYLTQDTRKDPILELRRALPEFEASPERFLEMAPRIAYLYAWAERPKEAVDVIDEVIARQPTADNYRARAGVLSTRWRKKEALADLGRAIEMTADTRQLHELLLQRVRLALEAGELDLALADIDRCIREFDEYSIHYSLRSLIHRARHDPVAADLDSERARSIDERIR